MARKKFNSSSTGSGSWESSQTGAKGSVVVNKKDGSQLVMSKDKAQSMVDSPNVSTGKKSLLQRILG